MENSLAADLDHVLARTKAEVWDTIRGQRIFITGGTGFFGRWLLESFAWANRKLDLRAKAVVLSRNPQAAQKRAPHLAKEAGIGWVKGDVRSITLAQVRDQIGESTAPTFGFCIHAATESAGTQAKDAPLEMFDTCVQGTRNMLELAAACGARRFLFTSSGAIYGPQPAELSHLPEDFRGGPDPLSVSAAYAEGKRAAEHLCAQWHHRYPALEPVIARCFAFAGPHLPLDAHFAVGNFVRDALAGGPIRVGGDGTPFRSYLYAADLAVWLWTMLTRAPALLPMNVGCMRAMSIAEIAASVAKIAGPNLSVEIARTPVPGTPPSRYVPDTSFAQRQLGLDCWVDFDQQIQRMMAWCRNVGA